MAAATANVGLIGLAVMGENLALNIASRGFTVCVYNRSHEKVRAFLQGRARGKKISGAATLAQLVEALAPPRKIIMLVKAGAAVDELVDQLQPLLARGDVLIDGGNSLFTDTIRRTRAAEARGLLYVGSGVSGGEDGALRGPSLMPGGSGAAWPLIRPVFEAICARTPKGEPCCGWMGADGAGHFVKMVHNGIEYGDMQLICEAYDVMKRGLGMSNAAMHETFDQWQRGELESYLIEITRDILGYKDERGEEVIDSILDAAGQKGTGKWTVNAALEDGVPLTLISEAVFARCLSALKDERALAAQRLQGIVADFSGDRGAFLNDLRQALYASKLISYTQGFQMLSAAAASYQWTLDYGRIAEVWRGGCIIRSVFLDRISQAYERNPALANLLLDPFFADTMQALQPAWRRVVGTAVQLGIPIPCLSAALAYFDGYRSARLPANLLQAQRDYFGAHTYERTDRPRGEFSHTNWTGRGGSTTSESYQA
jgi:6-phosphogluconate dehydrogenase